MNEEEKSPAENLKLRGEIIRGLQDNLLHGGHSLAMIPETITTIVNNYMWQEWVVPVTGEVKEYKRFKDFLKTPQPDGLNADMKSLKNLCRDDPAALDALDRATVGKRGNPTGANQYTEGGNDYNITNSSPEEPVQGTSNTYALRKLRKLRKDREDLHGRVLAGLWPHLCWTGPAALRVQLGPPASSPDSFASPQHP
jgi:hypothetical protein